MRTVAQEPLQRLLPPIAWEQRQALLERRRCGWCAEPVPARLVIGGGDCPHCTTSLYPRQEQDPDAILAALRRRWNRWKWVTWALIALGTFVAGFVPMLAAAVLFLGLLGLHVGLVRRPLRWLTAGRRFTTRFLLRMLLAILGVLNLAVATLAPLVPAAGSLVVAICSVLSAILYTEVALRFIGNRLRREQRDQRLDKWEWLLPASLLGGLVGSVLGMVGLAAAMLYLLLWMDIPGVSDIAAFLLSTRGG